MSTELRHLKIILPLAALGLICLGMVSFWKMAHAERAGTPAENAEAEVDLERKVAAMRAKDDAERAQRPSVATTAPIPLPLPAPTVDLADRAIDNAHAKDKTARAALPARVKALFSCSSVDIEADTTVHAEACTKPFSPLEAPDIYAEMKDMGILTIHNHVEGKAFCAYALKNFPEKKFFTCRNGSWPLVP